MYCYKGVQEKLNTVMDVAKGQAEETAVKVVEWIKKEKKVMWS